MNDSVENYTAENGINAPYRAGYTFDGWVSAQKDYDAKDVYQAPNGTALSALWTEGDPEPDPYRRLRLRLSWRKKSKFEKRLKFIDIAHL